MLFRSLGGTYGLYARVRGLKNNALLAESIFYVKVKPVAAIKISAGEKGGLPGEKISFKIEILSDKEIKDGKIRLIAYDLWHRAVWENTGKVDLTANKPLKTSREWQIPENGPDSYLYRIRAQLLKGGKVISEANCQVYDYTPFNMRKMLGIDLWHGTAYYPRAVEPSIIKLLMDHGLTGIGVNRHGPQSYWMERYGQRSLTTALGGWVAGVDPKSWLPGPENKKDIELFLKRRIQGYNGGMQYTPANVLYDWGEEGGFQGSANTFCWDSEYAPESANKWFRHYLKNIYGTIGKLNKQWGSSFKSWDEIKISRDYAGMNGKYRRKHGWKPPKITRQTNLSPFVDTKAFFNWYYRNFVKLGAELMKTRNPSALNVLSLDAFGVRTDVHANYSHWGYPTEYSSTYRAMMRKNYGDMPFYLMQWGFFDNVAANRQLFIPHLLQGTTYFTFWYETLNFNPDLTHCLASFGWKKDLAVIKSKEQLFLDQYPAESNEVVIGLPENNYNNCGRSEERRVGKECRSRWSPYH